MVASSIGLPAALVAARSGPSQSARGGRLSLARTIPPPPSLLATRGALRPLAQRGPAPVRAGPEDLVKSTVGKPKFVSKSIDETIDDALDEDNNAPEIEPEWNLKYLYDGGCTVCLSLVKMLRSRKGHENIYFEDITAPAYSPVRNKGITYEVAMETIHVITKKGDIVVGMDGLTMLYSEVGLGWVFKLAQLPLISKVAEIIYKLISKNRLALGGGMDAVMAMGRINMEKEGTGTCEADGECRAKDPEPEPAMAKGTSTASTNGTGEAEEPPPIVGAWNDTDNVLGIYTYGLGDGLRGAPIDVDTGRFLVPGHSVRLKSHDFETLITAIDELILKFQWKGTIGLGLPGLLSRSDQAASEWMPDNLKNGKRKPARRSKWEFEEELKTACNHNVVVMSGAEANGYGEIKYGAGKDLNGLVLMITLGRGFGAAMYDDGVLVKNISNVLLDELWSWDLPIWADAPCPEEEDDDAAWDRWGERVQTYLKKLEDFCHPDHFIIGGSGTKGSKYELLEPRLTDLKTPLHKCQLGPVCGVKGAAFGAKEELRFRTDLAALRAAIGKRQAVSPTAMSNNDIKNVFALFDKDGNGELDVDEVADAINLIGVKMAADEVKDLVFQMDIDGSGKISFDEFKVFWNESVIASDVTLMHTLAEYTNALEEESSSGRLIVLEVGFTYCKPCRAFEPKYHAFAKRFKDARFLRINGNENQEMVTLGRDILKVRSSPSFYLFRNGEQVFKFTGAKEDKFEDALLQNLRPGEAGYVAGYEPKDFNAPPKEVATAK
mmetsp:Transcript_7196/g.18480  ORF Transcript_7196/g.18480 Transcript_7196/m.18480 type:complete len:777 (-) Transcript_7196:244-2574(-)